MIQQRRPETIKIFSTLLMIYKQIKKQVAGNYEYKETEINFEEKTYILYFFTKSVSMHCVLHP